MNKFLVASIPRSLLASLLFVLGTSAAFGLETTGTLDVPFDAGTFTDGQVNASIIQPDGKFLICGSFTKANGVTRRNIARFNSDGTLDATFDPGSGTDSGFSGMILQPDNKILIFGGFSTVNGVPRFASIARLESNGSLDAAFNPGNVISSDGLDDGAGNATSNGFIQAVVLQPGGKIVVFGQFYFVITGPGVNVTRSCVARFNSDGTFDATYNPGTGFTSLAGPNLASVSYVVRQNIAPNDGKIVVVGDFDGYNGNAAVRMLRLDANGAYDPTFTPPAAIPLTEIGGLFAQADDQVIVFGLFVTFGGGPHNAMVRLSAVGAVDAGFNTALFKDYGDPGQVAGVAQQANGKLVVGGYFHTLGGTTANNVARLETNGTRDASFATGSACGALGFNAFAIAVRPSDQEVLVGGWFPAYDGVNRNNIALLKTDGSLEPAFAPSSGVTDALPEIYSIVPQPDGKIIIGGVFTSFNGIPLHNIVRLNPDGTRDATFGITTGTSRSVRAMAVQTDGKIIIAGQFTAIDGVAQGRVARLNMDGTVDPTFNPGTGPDSICYAVALDAAGNVYVGGGFLNVNGTPRAYIAKLTSTGALDTTFNPGTGFNNIVRAIAPPNGAAGPVVGGSFSFYNGVAANRIARLDATTGARDAAFTASFNSTVRAITLTPGGSYFVGGSFSQYTVGAVARSRVARVMANGALDPAYVGPTITGTVRALALQANGKIVAGGNFSSATLKQIARFSSTGVQDPLFTTGTGAISSPADAFSIDNSAVDALAFQADGKMLVGGIFNQYNGVPRLSFARLTDSLAFTAVSRKVHPGSGTFDISLPVTGPRGVECRTGGGTNGHQVVFTIAGPVTFTSAAITSGTGTVSTASGGGTSTITVDLTGVTNAQTITLTLNGVSDGLNMANLAVPMGVLIGDTNNNGSVSGSDISQTKAQSGQAVTAGNFRTDVNVSGGFIGASDIGLVKAQSGTSLP